MGVGKQLLDWWEKRRFGLTRSDEQRIVDHIATLERRTTGELRAHLSARKVSRAGVTADARAAFAKVGMTATKERNGVLVFVSMKSQEFAIVGDEGIHLKVGDAGWARAAEIVREDFKRGDYTSGLMRCLDYLGGLLAEHFPAHEGAGANPDELPNTLSRD